MNFTAELNDSITVHDSSTVITTQDYQEMLDSKETRKWTLESPDGSFLLINVSVIHFAPKEPPFWVKKLCFKITTCYYIQCIAKWSQL